MTSLPFANVLMPLLAVPLALRSRRRGGLWSGAALAIGVGFAYMLLLMLGIAVGPAGHLPPWVAAWAGNLLFAIIAVRLFRRAERGG